MKIYNVEQKVAISIFMNRTLGHKEGFIFILQLIYWHPELSECCSIKISLPKYSSSSFVVNNILCII
jgi:hypothetical protein